MALMVAGCMMSVFMLVMQFPVAVQLSNLCVTYNFKQTCGLKGSSVEFPCSYPKHLQVIQGQTIMLTCVHTCTENLNANPAYIWYKGGLQLNGLSANVLSFQSISEEDMGNYACAVIGYADLPSSPFTLRVRRIPGNTMVSGHGSNKDKVPARTLCHDAQCSMQPNIDNCHTPRGMSTLSVMLIPCFCMGLLIAVMVAIQLLIAKKKKQTEIENRQSAGSVYGPPDCNSDTYEDVDIDTSSPNEKLDRVRQCLPVYENIQPAHHRF
ncbi:hypothetical protein Q5P01_023743 [Channa striata]|uniref:Ig-like domain-containing protein n=1 Tax=Channa striata TaxID=64152 RepID=A0AA88IU47_CHASR|nr:hypothetical protein Q5P01_023743 [Channa striata]